MSRCCQHPKLVTIKKKRTCLILDHVSGLLYANMCSVEGHDLQWLYSQTSEHNTSSHTGRENNKSSFGCELLRHKSGEQTTEIILVSIDIPVLRPRVRAELGRLETIKSEIMFL